MDTGNGVSNAVRTVLLYERWNLRWINETKFLIVFLFILFLFSIDVDSNFFAFKSVSIWSSLTIRKNSPNRNTMQTRYLVVMILTLTAIV